MKAKFFEGFKAVDDASATTASSDFRATKFHGINAVALKTNVFYSDFVSRRFFGSRGFNNGWTGFATKE